MATPDIPSAGRSDPEAVAKRRRGRNIAMLVALLLLCAVFYAVTWVKMTKS